MKDYRLNRMRQRVGRAYWRERCAELEQAQAHDASVAVVALLKVQKLERRCEKLERVAKAARAIREMPSYSLLCRCIECTAAKIELEAALAALEGE